MHGRKKHQITHSISIRYKSVEWVPIRYIRIDGDKTFILQSDNMKIYQADSKPYKF